MIGAIIGDIIGSVYECKTTKLMEQALEYLPQEFLEIIRIFEDTFRIRYD